MFCIHTKCHMSVMNGLLVVTVIKQNKYRSFIVNMLFCILHESDQKENHSSFIHLSPQIM